MSDPRPSPTMKRNRNSMKTKYRILMSKQDPSHLEHSNNVYVPLLIDSSDINGAKTIPAKQRLYKQTIKTF